MFNHGPSCLNGPRTRGQGWWNRLPSEEISASELAPPSAEDRPLRTELVERIRREIAEGVYETPNKWEAALDRLLDRLWEP
jgi:hypothetical protein